MHERLVERSAPGQCDDVPATPVLDWAPVTGAGGYLVYIAEDPDFTNRLTRPRRNDHQLALDTDREPNWTALADNQSGWRRTTGTSGRA